MKSTITAYTRPSGTVVIRAHHTLSGALLATTSTRTAYPFLIVHLWSNRVGDDHKLFVDKRTRSYDTAVRELRRAGTGAVALRRHSDDTYSEMDAGWNDRQSTVRRQEAEARWHAERDGDHHQVLVRLTDDRVVRIGDPRRHFDWGQAIMRHEALTADPPTGMKYAMVRAEDDPQWADVPWATSADLADPAMVA